MARHRVPVQALRNFISILMGFAIGGLNNLVVLPWVFGDDKSTWGLVTFSAAWAATLAPILAFGSPASMNRFRGRCKREGNLAQLYGSLAQPGLILFVLFIVLPALLFPETSADILGLQGEKRSVVRPIALLTGLQTGHIYFISFLSSNLKTSLATFTQETLFKMGYLALVTAVGYGIVSHPQFLPGFICLYVLVLIILIAQAIANGFRIDIRGIQDRKLLRELRWYSGTMILGSSASMIIKQIDIIMVGRLMSLEWVPLFAIASFIAAVVQIPKRAVGRLWNPLLASAIDKVDITEAFRIVKLNHQTVLLTSGWILACICACLPEVNALLHEDFRGLNAVILTIGCLRMIEGSSGGSMMLLGQSKHYSWLIALNWGMVFIAIPLNLFFIPDSGLGLGLLGAALATLVSTITSILCRQWVIWHLWKRFTPSVHSIGIVLCLATPACLLTMWTPDIHPLISLLLKSASITVWAAIVTQWMKLAPEATAFALKSFSKSGGNH